MTILSIPKIEMNAAGHLVILKEGVSLDPLAWTWEASVDGGASWTEHTLVDGMFAAADTTPGTLYRAREIFTEKEVFNPLYHEFVFDLTEEVSANWGIIKWTLTQPASATQATPVVTETFSDARDVVDWSALYRTTHADRYEERQVRDNGDIEVSSFLIDADGIYVQQSHKTEDGADLRNWQSITTRFDEERGQDIKLIVFDSGLERTEFRGATGLDEIQLVDAADTKSWEALSYLYEHGFRTEQVRVNDSGSQTQYRYARDESGQSYTQSTVTSDQSESGDAFTWRTIETNFDANGEKTGKVISYDDGRVRVDGFEDGSLASRSTADVADIKTWESLAYLYDDGFRTEQHRVNDNGTETRTLYAMDEAGKSYVQASIRSDFSEYGDAFSWRSVETRYDSDGELMSRVYDFDDGRVREDGFELGVLSSRVYTDHDDQYSWHQINEVWEDGVRVARDVVDDAFLIG